MSDIYKLILTKEGIFESINRTTFTATGLVCALLASTQTQLYETNHFRVMIKLIALSILLINILYTYNNITDFSNFLKKYKQEYDVNNLLQKTQYMYILFVLLILILLMNLYLLIN
tara:strand:- start:2445 stop:2792 length:348 start_codon:yes stop_codon:yes gene_type:complete